MPTPAMVARWRHWYAEARANGHSRLWAARWALRVAWILSR
jgi:hypothetical protein